MPPFCVGNRWEPAQDSPGRGTESDSDGSAAIAANVAADSKLERRHPGDDIARPRHKFSWESNSARQLLAQVDRVASVNSTLLLLGESGTGKSTIARMIHRRSARKDKPFIALNCASLPAELIDAELFGHARGAFTGALTDRIGRVEAAAGGTLFLDEIGDLPLLLQPKLLTFLQDRTFYRLGGNEVVSVDVRVISATNFDLIERSKEGKFRRDLYFRLAALKLKAPTLAERRGEIGEMSRHILQRIDKQNGTAARHLTADALAKLTAYDWPGNIRELENVLESASTFCESSVIDAADIQLPSQQVIHDRPRGLPDSAADFLSGKTLSEIEREAIIVALKTCHGNKTQTARLLGISLRSVYNRMEKHGLVVTKSLNSES
jgi:DNA-binding NtrC family response regulator